MMSGSGPSVFAIFSSDEDAALAQKRLEIKGYKGYLCHPIEI
jgi:4-diphosphocytidyl-2C-methyl-D-erythritol kinase